MYNLYKQLWPYENALNNTVWLVLSRRRVALGEECFARHHDRIVLLRGHTWRLNIATGDSETASECFSLKYPGKVHYQEMFYCIRKKEKPVWWIEERRCEPPHRPLTHFQEVDNQRCTTEGVRTSVSTLWHFAQMQLQFMQFTSHQELKYLSLIHISEPTRPY